MIHLIHRFKTKRWIGLHRHQECKVCGKRRIKIEIVDFTIYREDYEWLGQTPDPNRINAYWSDPKEAQP